MGGFWYLSVVKNFKFLYGFKFWWLFLVFLLFVQVSEAGTWELWIFAGKLLMIDYFFALSSFWVLVLKHHRMFLEYPVFFGSKDLVLVVFFLSFSFCSSFEQ
ncbi:hypothetical protein KFK09_014504 [Dendrobium nobile]|uniref:Uncharacterized protein n=1 Tax=Dendrobium nobile TaxID=94219 RepID=A0A8T3B2C0_DENNO|nr:hypothetical protein KFK09_014504 [Dendrobium nobile]